MARRICRVVAVGDAIVDRITPPMRPLPRGDFQGHIAAFETLPGGNATNFALQVARLGAKTTFVGVLGRDANAHLLREAYRRQGVRSRPHGCGTPHGRDRRTVVDPRRTRPDYVA